MVTIDPKDCKYCNTWMAYGSNEEDNAMIDKKKIPPSTGTTGWNVKECHRLLKLLYLDEISIKEFKKMFTAAGMDYNQVEHCCGCAGCYKRKSHTCPDFCTDSSHDENDDGSLKEDIPDCKIFDPIYFCDICERPGKYGFFLNKDGKQCIDDEPTVSHILLCKKHSRQIEADDYDVLVKHVGV